MTRPHRHPGAPDAFAPQPCDVQGSGAIELYFYDELTPAERADVETHLEVCAECRVALDELRVIRQALAGRPAVSSPPAGDWTGFMVRLHDRVQRERAVSAGPPAVPAVDRAPVRGAWRYLAVAALLTLVTAGVVTVARYRGPRPDGPSPTARVASLRPQDGVAPAPPAPSLSVRPDRGFVAVSGQHFERSKLVILGLASKDAQTASASDWAYERRLASSLLDDTRIYRQAAAERGLDSLAGIMSDLELVLLQASLSDHQDTSNLDRLQRLIRKRDLVTKMDAFEASAGGF